MYVAVFKNMMYAVQFYTPDVLLTTKPDRCITCNKSPCELTSVLISGCSYTTVSVHIGYMCTE